MHLKRVIVASVLLPAIYFYIMYLPSWSFLFLLIIVSFIAMTEFYSMYHIGGILRYACLLFGVLILGVSYIYKDLLPDVIILSVMVIICIRLLVKRNPI